MADARKFLDWSQPALPAVVADLKEQYTVLGTCDLSNVLAVFPGQQAGRRFLELLTTLTRGQVSPPEIITVGQLPEKLYEPQFSFASQLTQRLAWAEALKNLPTESLEAVVATPPGDRDVDTWMSLGELLSKQHRELAADLLSFSDVADKGSSLPEFDETSRWGILSQVQQTYLSMLDEFKLWDQQTARLVAIDQNECRTQRNIVLIGTVDLNRTMRAMIDQVKERVTIYVHGPANLTKREKDKYFDDYGCLKPEKWGTDNIDIGFDQVQVVDGPAEQAEAIVRSMANYHGQYAMEDITVSLPDDRIVPHVQRTLKQFDVPTRWVIARKLYETAPYRLLSAVADFAETNSTKDFAALVRHPDVSAWITSQGLPENWLTSWDVNLTSHLQRNTNEILGDREDATIAQRLYDVVNAALHPLMVESRPLSEWAEPLTQFLLHVYGLIDFDRENPVDQLVLNACRKLHKGVLEHTSLPDALVPVVTAPQAIRLTLEQVKNEIITPSSMDDAVQLFGWLDMALDDAPAAIITSFNEGYVPSSMNHDLFLPNRLRTHLEIEDNARRYARDAYALNVLLHSRKSIDLIVAKRDVQGEPMIPSRLLFATDAPTVARRIKTFFGDEQEVKQSIVTPLQAGTEAQFSIPKPQPLAKPKKSFSVTEFSAYLMSPYRYYLGRILKLKEMTDDIEELDPMSFGNVIHDVLNDFGISQLKNSQDQDAISEFLLNALHERMISIYGSNSFFPVTVQQEQIKSRLRAFAEWQVGWRAQGWEIRHSEVGSWKGTPFRMEDGTNIYIRGRIDRIDYNSDLNKWAILDYKTGESGNDPERKHRYKGEWQDFQLPLYRHLAKELNVDGDVILGYVDVPKDSNDIGAKLVRWSDEELEGAYDAVRATARKIINQEFWTELDRPYPYRNEFDPICQTGVFGQEALV